MSDFSARPKGRNEFDYIIVGAGSSGCVIANRLSEDKDISVLLLDAGGPEPDPRLDEIEYRGSRFDWQYHTEPEPELRNRQIAWPRGRMLGGSSAMSGMTYVRGNRLNYDHWNSLGNEGWAFEDLLPYFRRSETNGAFRDEYHGNDGPLSVESVSDQSVLKQAFFEASELCGFKSDPKWDFNGARQEGVAGHYQKTAKNGAMQSVGAAFLVPCLDRPNLTTRPFSQATKLVWDRDRAVGVEYASSHSDAAGNSLIRYLPAPWNIHTARVRREVIICAGVVESPRLLMLSGVGPAEQLRRHGIPVRINLPGVGQNLQDHPNINFIYRPNSNIGPIRNRIGTSGLFLRTQNGLQAAAPDLQLFVLEVVVEQEAFGLKPGPLYFCTACLVRPQSAGSITLASADPMAAPVIRANYLQSQPDLEALISGFDLVRRLSHSGPLGKLLAAEMMPGADCRAPEQIEEFVRQSAGTNFHPVGACKMGHDTMAVVDAKLRVRGAQGLRIADASIMPTIVNGNTIAACVMIGEKASEMIRNT